MPTSLMRARTIAGFLACGFLLHAEVSYDVIRSAKWLPAQTDSSAQWTGTGVYSISPNFYAPFEPGTEQEVTHVHIKDHKLSAVGSKIWRIYDLDSATLTTINLEAHIYKIDSLDAAYAQYQHRIGRNDFQVSAHKRGKTVSLYGQDAVEFEIVATAKRKTSLRLLCWVGGQPPTPELDEFQKRWLARTNVPFLADLSPSTEASNPLVAIAKAQADIPGYILGFVTEEESEASHLDLEGRPSSGYDASYNHLPSMQSTENALDAAPGLRYNPLAPVLAGDRLIQFNLLNFSNESADPRRLCRPLGLHTQETVNRPAYIYSLRA